jgi:hypothetical protein
MFRQQSPGNNKHSAEKKRSFDLIVRDIVSGLHLLPNYMILRCFRFWGKTEDLFSLTGLSDKPGHDRKHSRLITKVSSEMNEQLD